MALGSTPSIISSEVLKGREDLNTFQESGNIISDECEGEVKRREKKAYLLSLL